MSSLPTDSYASLGVPLWLSALNSIETPSPFAVVDAIPATKSTFIVTKDSGDTAIILANPDGTNPVAMTMTQGLTVPENTVAFVTDGATTAMTIGSNVTCAVPFVLDTPACPTNLLMSQSGTGTSLQQGTGGTLTLKSSGVPSVVMNDYVGVDSAGGLSGLVGGEGWALASIQKQLAFVAPGATAVFGLSGTSAYVGAGAGTPTFYTPGLVVNSYNGANLRFTDSSANPFEMEAVGSNLIVYTPAPASLPAITVASSGQVTIPDIVSGSFVPIGGVIMYSGLVGSLPTNWKVCDGTFGTPDLRDRFVIGAGTFASGSVGGSTTISVAQMPQHAHSITDVGHSHNVVLTGLFNNGDNGTAIVYAGQSLSGSAGNRQSDPGAAQLNTTGIIINDTGSGSAYYQPYYALAYIIRVA